MGLFTENEELEELREIVSKLSTSADGVPVTPGMTLYLDSPTGMHALPIAPKGDYCWYSTKEAATAAFKKKRLKND